MSVPDAAGPSRPLTWAERLAGKTSTTPSSKPSQGSSSLSPQRKQSSGLSTSIQPARAPSAITASSTASIGGNSSMHSAASLSSQTTTAPVSAASSFTGKSRVPTSTDSGWGEADSSLESGHSDLSQSFTTQSISTVSETAVSQTASTTLESSKAPQSVQGESNAVKPPSGPPKVNIWQLRKEEAARKASELEKLKAKPTEPQKQQVAAPTAPEIQADDDTMRQKGPSVSVSPTAGKSNKKKREINTQLPSSHERQASSRNTPATGEDVSQHSKPATTDKQGQRSGKQDGQSAGLKMSRTANTRETASSENSFNANSTRRSPLQKTNGTATINQTSVSTPKEATIEGNILGKQDKNETSKNAEAKSGAASSSRKQESGKEIKASLQPSQNASIQTEAGGIASDSMSRNSSKRSDKGGNVSDVTQASLVVGQISLDTVPNDVDLASSKLEDRTAALASTSTAPSTTSELLISGATASIPARAASASMIPKTDTVRQAALPSSLPAKPIGAPTEPSTSLGSPTYGYAGNKARASPSGTNQAGTANAESRSQISPAGATSQIEGTKRGTRGEAALSGRHASLGGGYTMARPAYDYSGIQSGGYYPSIAPGQSYAGGGAGMQSSGGYGNGRGGKHGGMSSGKGRGGRNGNVYNPRNQPSPTVGMYGTSSQPLGMGHQPIYPGVGPAGSIGTLPPNVFFDHNQAYQLDAYGNPVPAYYAAPSMYGQPGAPPPQAFYMGSPGPFAAPLPPPAFVQHQQLSTLPSSAASEASVGPRSQPGSPVPTALQIPPFQSMGAAKEAASRTNASGAGTSGQFGQTNGQIPSQGQQLNQPQATSAPISLAPQRPTPIYDYSFIAFPPDGTAFWVLGQIEYYMSPDNLARDIFLRQSMFDEGWIEIGLIASFQRLSNLTKDIYLVRSMMETSFMCEVREMMVRPRDWRQWLLPGARKVVWQFPEPNMHPQQHAPPQGQPAPVPAQHPTPHQVPPQPIAAPPS